MAIFNTCAVLGSDHDASCLTPARKYFQQAVVINKGDIETFTITKPDAGTCNYNVDFTMKAGKTGYRITGPENGSIFYGGYDKSRSPVGLPQYSHQTQVLIVGATEDAKCILDSLDKGSFVVALQFKDGTVEIYGIQNGLSTPDYSYNLQENGGGVPIMLQSLEDSPEGTLPLIYKPAAGDAKADFDDNFQAAA